MSSLAQILKAFMALSCLEAASDPPSRFCIRSDQEVNGRLSCAKEAKEVALLIHPKTALLSLFPYSVFSVQRKIQSAEK